MRTASVLGAGFLLVGMFVAGGPTSRAGSLPALQSVPVPSEGKAGSGSGQPGATPDARSDRQKALAQEADRLFGMATELKMQVDKTNKNILSLKVVEKAGEIEALAKGMKLEAKK